MTDEQICEMLNRHRLLIQCEMKMLIHRINGDSEKECLQESFNDTEWNDFAKWFKVMRDE
jgi:hypothetical protein